MTLLDRLTLRCGSAYQCVNSWWDYGVQRRQFKPAKQSSTAAFAPAESERTVSAKSTKWNVTGVFLATIILLMKLTP